MDKNTSVITLAAGDKGRSPRVLDIGMAPGGFSQTVLRKHRNARIRGITLPSKMGGLQIMLPRWTDDLRIRIEFADITMLTNEIGRPPASIPTEHPEFANFSSKRPFQDEMFNLIKGHWFSSCTSQNLSIPLRSSVHSASAQMCAFSSQKGSIQSLLPSTWWQRR